MDEIDAAGQDVREGLFGLDSAILAVTLIYVTVVAAAYLRFGTLPEFSFAIAAVLILPFIGLATKSKEFMKNSALVVAVLLTYEALQGITGTLVRQGITGTLVRQGIISTLVRHGGVPSLAWVDQALVGTNFAADVQAALYSSATTFVSTVFYGMHVFLIMIAFVLFWFRTGLSIAVTLIRLSSRRIWPSSRSWSFRQLPRGWLVRRRTC
jgi:hypothetical protein